ncbi:MAG: zinc ribbon domain-containing protein [Lachnospiraceae bacterium]|nr:zinc ribbon domain-containing protein [Lachnospiraceae bacterium]
MVCPKCGAKLPDWKYYCDSCGTSTDGKLPAFLNDDRYFNLSPRRTKIIMIAFAAAAVLQILVIVSLAVHLRNSHEKAMDVIRAEAAPQAGAYGRTAAVSDEGTGVPEETASDASGAEAAAGASEGSETGESLQAAADENINPAEPLSFAALISNGAVVSETLLWDDVLRITATGLECAEDEVRLLLHFENNYERNLVIQESGWRAVNGYMLGAGNMVGCSMVPEIKAGGSTDGYIVLKMSELEELCITHISQIQINLDISDSESFSAHSGPLTVKTDSYTQDDFSMKYADRLKNSPDLWETDYEIKYAASDTLAEQAGISVISEAMVVKPDEAAEDGSSRILSLEIENKSDLEIYVSTMELNINGLLVGYDNSDVVAIAPGCRAVKFYSDSLFLTDPVYSELFGIKEIGRAVFCLYAVEAGNDWTDYLAVMNGIEINVNGSIGDFSASGPELANSSGITVGSAGAEISQDSPGRAEFIFYVTNNTGIDILIGSYEDKGTVNGVADCYVSGEYNAIVVPAGRTRDFRLYCYDEENSIGGEVRSLETVIATYDRDDNLLALYPIAVTY